MPSLKSHVASSVPQKLINISTVDNLQSWQHDRAVIISVVSQIESRQDLSFPFAAAVWVLFSSTA